MANYSTQTIETALTILAEWNANSRSPVAVCKPDGAKLFRDALATAKGLEGVSRSIERRAEHACNFPRTEEEKARSDGADRKAADKGAKLLKPWGLGATFAGGDPRGGGVHIETPKTGRFNTMGGADAGWAV